MNFIETDSGKILQTILTALENGVSEPLYPGDERRVFAEAGLAPLFVSLFNSVNDACRQKMLRYARGEVLDALGENWKCERQTPTKATVTLRFYIAAAISQNIVIPQGLRVTSDSVRYFTTDETVVLQAGQTYVEVSATAMEGGVAYNDIPIGAIKTIVDVSLVPLVDGVMNTTASENGADEENDESYRARIRESDASLSTAGPSAAYRYWAIKADPTQIADAVVDYLRKTVKQECPVYSKSTEKHIFLGGEFFEASTLKLYTHGGTTPKTEGTDYSYTYSNGLLDIELISSGSLYSESTVDVEIVVEQAGCVEITPICYGGEVPSASLLQAVLESCSAPDVKPLTDRVSVKAPDVIYYDIEIEYYTTEAEESACVASVEGDGGAIDRYNYWQGSSLNRDLNPDYLRKLILAPDWEGSVAATMVNVVKPVYQDLPATTIAKFSGNKTVTHVVREGVN